MDRNDIIIGMYGKARRKAKGYAREISPVPEKLEFQDKIFVHTSCDSETDIDAIIAKLGGEVRSSTVLKTDYLVIGNEIDHKTTKITRAEELNTQGKRIVAVTEEEFWHLVFAAGEKITVKKSLFGNVDWTDENLALALEKMDLSKLTQKSLLEFAVEKEFSRSLEIMAQMGWLTNSAKLEGIIEFARAKQKAQTVAWLLDFQNRTVNFQAVAARKEARILRELGDPAPGSVAAMKKIWSYKKLDDGTLALTSYKGSDTEVIVPSMIGKDKVSTIGNGCFDSKTWENRIPNKDARRSIQKIVIPDGVTAIEGWAFHKCISLSDITIPNSVTGVGEWAFSGCKNLTNIVIPSGITCIGDDAFDGCTGLTNVAIVDSVTSIGNDVFRGCDSLTQITVSEGNLFYSSDEQGILYDKSKSLLIQAPGAIKTAKIPDSVITIHKTAFRGCSRLTEVIIPDSITEISEYVFCNCTTLTNITIPVSVTDIGDGAFDGCSGLTDITIPNSVNSIGAFAFSECTGLTSIAIPNSVARIDMCAFSDCSKLTSVTFADRTIEIDPMAFFDCPSLTIHAPAGSCAESYATKYNIPFVAE